MAISGQQIQNISITAETAIEQHYKTIWHLVDSPVSFSTILVYATLAMLESLLILQYTRYDPASGLLHSLEGPTFHSSHILYNSLQPLSVSLAMPVFFLYSSFSRSPFSQGFANIITFPWKAPPSLLYLSFKYQLTYFIKKAFLD